MVAKRLSTAPSAGTTMQRVIRSRNLHLQERATQENQTESPFLQLPPELRIVIYTFVIRGHLHVRSTPPSLQFRSQDEAHKNALALLFACRQVRAEAVLLPYALNTFSLSHIFIRGGAKSRFLKARTVAQLQSIQAIYFSYHIRDRGLKTDKSVNDFKFLTGWSGFGDKIRVFVHVRARGAPREIPEG
ncbi:hypothetical protein CC86DRAFT_401745 [Ophiobolus disseminans]|uniref:DUF7730 domain-containing protein n=1 Tax=Ophiobolus disseminans TaxID=1469910 RepID=A0A6A7AEP7_9PLEO|nr:hypothetical protein CC86DRAFT_401745 [Ophiobolus disseminans]